MLTKNTFVEEIRKQYVLVARAKGLSERRVLYKHVFRNALIPIVTGFPAAFVGAFFAGSLLIETLFSLDGLGPAGLRVDRPARLSGRAGHALLLHADRPRRQADRRPAVRRRRPARAVRGGRQMSAAGERDRERAGVDAPARRRSRPPRARRATSLSPNQRAWARFKRNRLGYVSLLVFAAHAGRRHVRRARSATTGRWSRATRASGTSRSSATRRRRASAATSRRRPTGTTRSSASSSRSPATSRCSRSTRTARSTLNYFARGGRPGAAQPRTLARHRRSPAATCWRGCSTASASASASASR